MAASEVKRGAQSGCDDVTGRECWFSPWWSQRRSKSSAEWLTGSQRKALHRRRCRQGGVKRGRDLRFPHGSSGEQSTAVYRCGRSVGGGGANEGAKVLARSRGAAGAEIGSSVVGRSGAGRSQAGGGVIDARYEGAQSWDCS
jgi:hypothetical protein